MSALMEVDVGDLIQNAFQIANQIFVKGFRKEAVETAPQDLLLCIMSVVSSGCDHRVPGVTDIRRMRSSA